MKTYRFIVLFVLLMACKNSNPKLEEAHQIHLDIITLLNDTENLLNSLSSASIQKINEDSLQIFKMQIEDIEKNIVEVPGFEQEQHHQGHEHKHDAPVNYTDDQILLIQKEMKAELIKIQEKISAL
ncbi:MAG: hypothetical protein LCH67_15125 [Bacteroidetes bacterium]|nr:hypothetical protein [Bacteroidota bacterium]